jgi:isoquinoline 1-oxidoreductase beta subunit
MTDAIAPTRRGLLAGAGGLVFAFALGAPRDGQSQAAGSGALNAYVRIATDGTITIQAPVPEMGQATNTAIPLIVAEELDADWSRVRIETAPVAEAFHNPVFRSQFVVASLSTRAYWMPARTAGAQARRVLIDAVAARWGVPADQLTTEPGMVVHAASNRRIGYGEVAAFATVPNPLPTVAPEQLKAPAQFRLIGRDVPRWDVPAKSTGRATYAIDADMPGMVHAVLARAPVMGSRPVRHNGDALRARPGVIAVVALENGVAVVAERIEQALAARRALEVAWSTAPASGFDSEAAKARYLADARDEAKPAVVGRRSGDVAPALAAAARRLSGEFTTGYVYHAQMEPLSCLASVTAEGVQVWAGTQWPSRVQAEAARIAGVTPDKVRVHMLPMGGGFGRRAHVEYATEAVEISKAVGRPVKLTSTREDDIANAHVRPMTAHRIDIGLDAAGKVTAWKHRIASDLTVPQLYGQARLEAQRGVDHIVMAHADVPLYDVANHLAEHVYEDSGVRTAPWRGIGAGPNAFAIECMVDELARAAGQDPLAYRLALLKEERGRAVLRAAAEMAGWPRAPEGAAFGIAFSRLGVPQLGESLAAVVAEIALDRASGRIAVRRLSCAVDVGLPVQPRNIARQVEGSLVWGVSSALKEEITFRSGAVQQHNFTDYEPLRLSEMPRIEVRVIRSGDIPLPVGELGLASVTPAIANAVATLTGKALRHAPFTPARVQAALRG